MKEETLLNAVEESTKQTEIKVDFPVDNTSDKIEPKVDLYKMTQAELAKKKVLIELIDKITIAPVNVRTAPNDKIVKVLKEGTKVKVKEIKDNWALLDDGNYIMASLLR